jgi:hypothetical protein
MSLFFLAGFTAHQHSSSERRFQNKLLMYVDEVKDSIETMQ